jgi:hypothetical protein
MSAKPIQRWLFNLAQDTGVDLFGVAAIGPVRAYVMDQGGESFGRFP